MKNSITSSAKPALTVALLLSFTVLLGTASAFCEEKHEYRVAGVFVEGCSCNISCPCDMPGGVKHGCQGVGAITLKSGSYQGVDLAGGKIVYATSPGSWVRLYIDAPGPRQQEAATAYAKATFSAFGKIEAVKTAKIDLSGKDGRYTLTVDGGTIVQLSTEPVVGADQKTPVTHTNTLIPFSPTIMQGRTLKGSFHDGERSFTLEGSNSYFNDRMQSSGKI